MTKKHFRSFKKFTKKRRKYQKGGNCCDYELETSYGCGDRNNYDRRTQDHNAEWFQCGPENRIRVKWHVKKHIDAFYGNDTCNIVDETRFIADFTACVAQNEAFGQVFNRANLVNILYPAGRQADVLFTPTSPVNGLPMPSVWSRAFLTRGDDPQLANLVQFVPLHNGQPFYSLQNGQPFFGLPGPGTYGIAGANSDERKALLNRRVTLQNFDEVWNHITNAMIFGGDNIRRERFPLPGQALPPTPNRLKLAIFIFFNVLLRIHTEPALVITHGWPGGMARAYDFSQMSIAYFHAACELSSELIVKILILMSNNNLGNVPNSLNQYGMLIRTFITHAVIYITGVMVAQNNYDPTTAPPWQNNADVIPPPAAPPVAAAAAPPVVAEDLPTRLARAEEAGRHAAIADVAIVEARNAALPPLPVGLGAAGHTGLAGFDNHNAARQGEILTPEEVAQNQADYNTLIGLNVVPTNDFEEQKKEWRRLRRENQNPENPNQNPLDYITEFGGRTKRRKRRKNKSKKNKHKK